MRKNSLNQVTYRMFQASYEYARNRPSASRYVQLPLARRASKSGPSAPRDTWHGRSGVDQHVAAIRFDVCQDGPPLDSAGEAVAGAVDPDALFGAQRTVV